MRFLVDASLPRSAAALIRDCGHYAEDVRDIGPSLARDSQIAEYAKARQFTVITADFDFADIRVYPPSDYSGIVVIDRPENSTVAEVLALVERLLQTPTILAAMPGRLAIVDPRRIRLRPSLPDDKT